METPDPKTIDQTLAFQKLNDLHKILNGAFGGKTSEDIFKGMTIDKSYPVTVNGKKGIINVLKDKTITMKFDEITSDEIIAMIKKIHD